MDFVGHPLLDALQPVIIAPADINAFLENNSLPDKPVVALLPGSRKQEIATMLPVMLSVIPFFNDHQFVIAASPSIPAEFYRQYLKNDDAGIVFSKTYELLKHAKAALVTSGTASLETALFEVPEVVCYKGNFLSYLIAKKLINIDYIALPNLILNRGFLKELIQKEFNVTNLNRELEKLLRDDKYRSEIKSGYKELIEILGGPGASQKTAELMIRYLTSK